MLSWPDIIPSFSIYVLLGNPCDELCNMCLPCCTPALYPVLYCIVPHYILCNGLYCTITYHCAAYCDRRLYEGCIRLDSGVWRNVINSSVSPETIFRHHYPVFCLVIVCWDCVIWILYVSGVQCPQYILMNLDDCGWITFDSWGIFQWITPSIVMWHTDQRHSPIR